MAELINELVRQTESTTLALQRLQVGVAGTRFQNCALLLVLVVLHLRSSWQIK